VGGHQGRIAGLRPDLLVIAIAKGMAAGEDGSLRILPDVLAEQIPAELRSRIPWAAIGGPSIAGEVAARRQTCVVFSGSRQAALDRLAATFRTSWYHVWTSTDLVGVEASAALKNCYAVGGGLPFSDASARMGDITLEGAAAIRVVGGALPKLTERGIIGPEELPLLRHLHAVVGHGRPPAIP
jgi:glycerol-3-phosphate dehydrogenase